MNPFIPALMIIALGMLLQRMKFLGDNAGQILSRIILNITLPAVVLRTVTTVQLPESAFTLPVIAIIWSLVMLGVGYLLFSKLPKQVGGVMILALAGFNIGLFAYPLVEATWGSEALALIIMYDIGNAFFVFGLGYILAGTWSGQPTTAKAIIVKLLTFVPLLSYVLALTLNLASVQLPELIDAPLKILGSANQTLVLLLIGLYLDFSVILKRIKQVLSIILVRYSISFAVGLALYFFLPVPELIKSVLLVTFLLPVPMSVLPYALEYNLDSDLAGALVNGSIILSFGLLWLAFAIL